MNAIDRLSPYALSYNGLERPLTPTHRPVNRHTPLWLALVPLVALTACHEPAMKGLSERAQKMKDYEKRTIRVPKNHPKKSVQKGTKNNDDLSMAERRSLDKISQAYDATRPVSQGTGKPEEVAVKKVAAAIRASLEIGPTLVVWIIDRTPSAQKIVTEARTAARNLYDADDIRQLSLNSGQTLQTSVIAFDDKAEFLIDTPTGDWQAAQTSLDKFQPSEVGRENTFAAVKLALNKFLPLRTAAESRRELIFVVLTDEAGDDTTLADELAKIVEREAIPIYCLGSPAPWGQVNPLAADPKKGDPTKTDDSVPRYGPESIASERVDLDMMSPQSNYGNSSGLNISQVDSGFGPFALERLCRAGGGQFLTIRPDVGSDYKYRGQSFNYWPSGSELRFAGNPVKYAPDYVSAETHRQQLAENKAYQALLNAAQLPRYSIQDYPDLRFPKSNEAHMKRTLDKAQQYAAKHAPNVDRFYSALIAGESDRAKLTSPRLQAEYDLALGRAMAIKARIDGYNSMIAALKRGKTFANASSTTWMLEPAEAYETESAIKKLGERAKELLERVKTDHPGTPWAAIAEHELRSPFGWTWKEQ